MDDYRDLPWNPDARVGDPDYRPGPDWPPSLREVAEARKSDEGLRHESGTLDE